MRFLRPTPVSHPAWTFGHGRSVRRSTGGKPRVWFGWAALWLLCWTHPIFPQYYDEYTAEPYSEDFMAWYESYREMEAWREWNNAEWANLLGDSYPEPEYVDADGNAYYMDSFGWLHDYEVGMSETEWAYIDASIYGIQQAYPIGKGNNPKSLYHAAGDARWLGNAYRMLAPRLERPQQASVRELYTGALLTARLAALGQGGSFARAREWLRQAEEKARAQGDSRLLPSIRRAQVLVTAMEEYRTTGRVQQALHRVEALRKQEPDRPEWHWLAAELYALQGMKAQAFRAYREAQRHTDPQVLRGVRLLPTREGKPKGIQ